MKRFAALLLAACAGCIQPSSESQGQEAQHATESIEVAAHPDGPVSDGANIIPSADEARLDTRLRAVFDKTQSALVVVTVKSLSGQDVAAYTNRLARQWKVGGERGGVVLIVAPNERQARIETDEKVRARLSDEQSAEIMQQVLVPRFRTGDFAGGIAAGVEAIASHL